jgi:hypothetical protein
VARECRAQLSYGLAGLINAVRIEVDWDARNSPGGFQADDELDCAAPLAEDLDDPVPCETSSPAFEQPGTAQVAIRVTDTIDGTQATATQPLAVAAAREVKGTVPGQRGSTPNLCAPSQPGVQCGPGNGRKTSGGGDKVPHNGWPAVTGILWKVLDSSGRKKVGGAANDELLGHHGSDRIFGGAGNDILWGDWDPANNNTHQKDVLDGGPGNDWLYPSHGSTVVKGGAGKDYVRHDRLRPGPGHRAGQAQRAMEAAQLRARPALLRLRLRWPRRLPEARREAQGHPSAHHAGRAPRVALSGPARAATSSSTTGSEPAGPSMVSVSA